ncbi:uncharacterized protein MKK02DRAFT_38673 [Dioszegia hungarica]|uniref:GATA-type domain-containing protein n=1 Tax=Dioszegia hungarica TaxID=4972 RepID=A0AA38H707_9TREE|nr:uncharacterized protein MKK02DRAFT_38673 [Dioszegia hungarica]KAI9634001.1 hypothetical protein MKK02DRAFT_38673 [Dioszegia hungarica]
MAASPSIQLTLDSIIDSSDPAQPPADVEATASATQDDSAPPSVGGGGGGEGSDAGSTQPKRKRTRKPLPKGSAADFKRKEANRLAAERSRSRVAEKRIALNKAYALLKTEHDGLAEAIAEIEAVANEATAEIERKAREEREQREQREVEAQVEAAIAVAQQEMESGGGERDERSILQALMSGGMGMEAFDGVGDDWVQGVENLMKEVETSGRLGELAAVAAVPADQEEEQAQEQAQEQEQAQHDLAIDPQLMEPAPPAEREVPAEDKGESEDTLGKFAEELLDDKIDLNLPQKMHEFSYNSAEAASATASAVAVVLNAEIEKSVRDEVALARAAVARIGKEIAKANGEDVEVADGSVILPEDISTSSQEAVDGLLVTVDEKRMALETEVELLRARVLVARQAKGAEEDKVAKCVEELHRIAMAVDEEERGKIMEILKSIRGHIGNNIWGLEEEPTPDDTLHGTAFSTSAIARRRRGRPPKNSFPLRYNHASMIYPTLPLDSPISTANLIPDTSGPQKRKRAPPGLHAKNKLAREAAAAAAAAASAIGPVDTLSAAGAEEYILSHLNATAASQASGQREGPDGLPLDPAFQSEEWTEAVLAKLKKGGPGSCDICARTETSVWRKILVGGEDYRVCNACGLYHRKFGVIRPPSLWGDGEAVKKRRAANGPEDGRRNRKVKKMLQNADEMKEQAQAEAEGAAEAGPIDPAIIAEGEPSALAVPEANGPGALGEDEEDMGEGLGMGNEEMMRLAKAGDALNALEGSMRDDGLEGGVGMGEAPHVDMDETGFETIEEELRGLHGEGLFAGMEESCVVR